MEENLSPFLTSIKCLYYLDNVRNRLKTKSSRMFLPNSDKPMMTQTNVASVITAAFKKADVFDCSEYERVSCTRIRCGLATFACNDGGFETAFVAKHFMKNREETTAAHYNLHSNRRHALNIAMKLYQSFHSSSGEMQLNENEVSELIKILKRSTKSIDKDQVLEWIKKTDPIASKMEINSTV